MSRFCINITRKHITIAAIIFAFLLMPILLFIKYWNERPAMTVIAEFQNTPLITHGLFKRNINAYYRGYKIGEVSDVKLADDQKSVLLYIDIFHKGLKLPENVIVEIGTEDIAGHQFVKFTYPKEPHEKILAHGMIIKGKGHKEFNIEKTFNVERIDKILSNLEVISEDLKDILHENKAKISASLGAGEDLEAILKSVRDIIDDKEIKQDLKNSVSGSAKILKDLNEEIKRAKTLAQSNNIAKLPNNISKISTNLENMNSKLDKTQDILEHTNYHVCGINNAVKKIPPGVLEDSDKAINNLNCFIKGLSETLSKPMLFWRFMFGNPAKSLEQCKKDS